MTPSDTFIDWLDLKQDHLKTFNMGNPRAKPKEYQTAYDAADAAYLERLAGHREFQEFDIYHGGIYARGQEVIEQREGDNIYYLLAGKVDAPKDCGFGYKRGRREGSFSTSVGMKSDGRIVQVSGNVGRLDRPNNLFNYGLIETVWLANNAIRNTGKNIPAFSTGAQFMRDSISDTDRRKGVSPWEWSGAYCNEIHVTRNYYAGSDKLAIESMRDMGGRRMARVSKAAFGDETINFGMPTRTGQRLHKAVVVYRKGPEMLAHAKGDDAKKAIQASQEYQLAMDTGIIRIECKFGSHYLRENNQRYLGELEMTKLIALYNRETAPLLLARADNVTRMVDAIPAKLRMSALSWIDGRDLRGILAKSTFKRHRKALLEYGLDITEARDLAGGRPNAEEALQRLLDALPQHHLSPMSAPDWYGLPELRAA